MLFSDVSKREDLQAQLDKGYRHPRPGICPAHFYNDIIINCWQPRNERPSFDFLKVAIKDALFAPIRRQ